MGLCYSPPRSSLQKPPLLRPQMRSVPDPTLSFSLTSAEEIILPSTQTVEYLQKKHRCLYRALNKSNVWGLNSSQFSFHSVAARNRVLIPHFLPIKSHIVPYTTIYQPYTLYIHQIYIYIKTTYMYIVYSLYIRSC